MAHPSDNSATEREQVHPDSAVDAADEFDPSDWDSVRAQFVLDDSHHDLSTFLLSTHPAPVRAAIDRHRNGLDRDPTGYLQSNEELLEGATRRAAAAYLGGTTEQLALTDSTTMGLGLLYAGLHLQPGDEVLTSTHDHYATHEALRLRADRDGVQVRKVGLYRDPAVTSVDEIVGNLAAALTERTRVVAMTWVHSGSGVKLPVRQLAEVIRDRNPQALFCLDGVHGFAAEDAAPDELGCDFLVSSCHKWLLGPRGTGFVWGTERAWKRTSPVIPSFDWRSIEHWRSGAASAPPTPRGYANSPGGYHSFEHRWALTEALEFHRRIGPQRVQDRTRELAYQLKAGLAGMAGVHVVTPLSADLSAGLVCCELAGLSPGTAVTALAAAGVVASSSPYNPAYVRFGPTIANSPEDVEAALRAVRGML